MDKPTTRQATWLGRALDHTPAGCHLGAQRGDLRRTGSALPACRERLFLPTSLLRTREFTGEPRGFPWEDRRHRPGEGAGLLAKLPPTLPNPRAAQSTPSAKHKVQRTRLVPDGGFPGELTPHTQRLAGSALTLRPLGISPPSTRPEPTLRTTLPTPGAAPQPASTAPALRGAPRLPAHLSPSSSGG